MSQHLVLSPGTPSELFFEAKDNTNLELREFYQAFVKCTGETMIRLFRDFFAHNIRVPQQFRWVGETSLDAEGNPKVDTDAFGNDYTCQVTDPTSGIVIGAEYGEGTENYPSLLLSDISGNINDLWLASQKVATIYMANPKFRAGVTDPEFQQPQWIEIGQRLSGKMELTITFKIRGNTKPERDQITDLVLHALVGPVRRDLYRLALNWLPNRGTIGGDAIEELTATRKIHVRSITFGLQTEWFDDFIYNAVTIEDLRGIPTKLGEPQL